MFRIRIIFIFLKFATVAISQIIHPKFSHGLIHELSEPQEYIEVQLLLKEQIDLKRYKYENRAKRVPFRTRAGNLVQLLRDNAYKSQAHILSILESYRAAGIITEIEPYWIVNAVRIVVKTEYLPQIADLKEVSMVFEADKAYYDAVVSNTTKSDLAIPNGIELGLRSIKATEMWKLGYTGYGTKAYIIDSGQEFTHPAIQQQYAGNFLPFRQVWSGGYTEPFDIGGHGTHVTGIICGLDRQSKDTIGVAFNAHWMGGPVQFNNAPEQPHPVGTFLSSMQFALDPDNDPTTFDDIPDVINNSWTNGNLFSCSVERPFDLAIQALEAAGVAIVWAAGNSGPSPSTLSGYQNFNLDLVSGFSVGATNILPPHLIADFSSRGPSNCGGEGALAIKPEVCAPGVGVRSAYLNNTYLNLNGTSMASPHVSGAVLLLKEAFPFLSGEDILLALYNTAIDLGEPGEDNDYGNGFIDVLAAYYYLIDQGHSPVPPVSAENDVILVSVKTSQDKFCIGTVDLECIVFNNRDEELNSLLVGYIFSGSNIVADTFEWIGSIPPHDYGTITISGLVFEKPGLVDYSIEIFQPNGKVDERFLNNRWLRSTEVFGVPYLEAFVIDSEGGEWCRGSQVLVYPGNLSSENYKNFWYLNDSEYTPVAVADRYAIPYDEQNKKIFLDWEWFGRVGKSISKNDQLEFIAQSNVGLVFDAFEDIVIRTVTINAENTGNMLVSIERENGTELRSFLVRIKKTGIQKVDLNIFVPEGESYRMLVKLPRRIAIAKTEVSFPYTIDGLVSIKRAEMPEQDIIVGYPYFFDWEISVPYPCGRAGVDLIYNESKEAPNVDFTYTNETDSIIYVNEPWVFESISDSSVIWHRWDFGQGDISDLPTVEKSFSAASLYQVSLMGMDDQSCISTALKTLEVFEKINKVSDNQYNNFEIKLYPNPAAHSIILIADDFLNDGQGTICISNSDGKIMLYSRISSLDLRAGVIFDISSIPTGIYSVSLQMDEVLITKKLVKI